MPKLAAEQPQVNDILSFLGSCYTTLNTRPFALEADTPCWQQLRVTLNQLVVDAIASADGNQTAPPLPQAPPPPPPQSGPSCAIPGSSLTAINFGTADVTEQCGAHDLWLLAYKQLARAQHVYMCGCA